MESGQDPIDSRWVSPHLEIANAVAATRPGRDHDVTR
jgi:hypothetical protein